MERCKCGNWQPFIRFLKIETKRGTFFGFTCQQLQKLLQTQKFSSCNSLTLFFSLVIDLKSRTLVRKRLSQVRNLT